MIGVDVRSNIREVQATFATLTDGLNEKAIVRALNRALDQAATAANREIRKVYNVRAKAVSAALKKRRATKGVSPQAVLEVRGLRLALIEFDASWSRRMTGASVRIKVGGARTVVPHAFIATTKAGYRGVFIRLSQAPPGTRYHGGAQAYKDPIVNLRSISVPIAFRNEVVLKAVTEVARDSFVRNFKQQIQFLGGKYGFG